MLELAAAISDKSTGDAAGASILIVLAIVLFAVLAALRLSWGRWREHVRARPYR